MSDLTGRLRLVLDTNVWLDWLVFDDPGLAPLRSAVSSGRAEVFIDETCAAELARVLGRKLGRRTLDATAQAAALAECRRLARTIEPSAERAELPKCRDSDDQKFLEAAAAARADVLVTKDEALLELSRRRTRPPPFRIVTPHAFAASAP